MKTLKTNLLLITGVIGFFACNEAPKVEIQGNENTHQYPKKSSVEPDSIHLSKRQDTNLDLVKANEVAWKNLIDVQSVNSDIYLDLRYATQNNFMKIKLYDTLTKAYLQRDVAERLSKCQELLTSLNKDLHLLVYDAVRPIQVQWKMWNALDSIPVERRVNFVSNPKNGSIHNYGAAVDITICDKNGTPLDMGAGYDDIRKVAYPSLEQHYLSTGELSIEQVENRKMLRKIMTSQDFRNIPTEWWHFNACTRSTAKAKYLPIY